MSRQIISGGGVRQAAEQEPADPLAESVDLPLQEAETRLCAVPPELHGWRLDRALAVMIPAFSRAYLQQLILQGAVGLAGQALQKPALKVTAGSALSVELRPTPEATAFVAQPMTLQVVHEDAHLLVIHKPAGLVVHPAAGHWSGTLLNGLLAHHRAAASLPRAGIVHRLDKDTSGLMLVGKSRPAVDALVRAIAAREVNRQYLALAHGSWPGAGDRVVDQAIGRDARNRLRMAVVAAGVAAGKPAMTTFRLLEASGSVSLLACKLHTGRTHQIRVHAAWLGHPLVGDTLYGGKPLWGLTRQALHAARLGLRHPVSGEALSFACEPPADFVSALHQSGLRYNPDSLE